MTTTRCFGISALAAIALMSSVAVACAQVKPDQAGAAEPTQRTNFFSPTCSLRDVQVVTLIDDLGDAQAMAGEKLFEAFLAVMRARQACVEGRESEALSIYDTTRLELTPTRTAR